jgi:hypothetical protein
MPEFMGVHRGMHGITPDALLEALCDDRKVVGRHHPQVVGPFVAGVLALIVGFRLNADVAEVALALALLLVVIYSSYGSSSPSA